MSAKGRKSKARDGKAAVRSERDFYETPDYTASSLFERLARDYDLGSASFLEPCAGHGAIIRAGLPWIKQEQWSAIELSAERPPADLPHVTWAGATDLLTFDPEGDFHQLWDWGITNPPFSIAVDVVEKMRQLAKHVIILQRLNFLGSLKRNKWWAETVPWRVLPLSERPIFTKDGSDSCEYAWFWWNDDLRRETILEPPLPAYGRAA